MNKYDFGGWATRNDLLCADGRTIRKDAFKSQDGQIVPIVYNHNHSDITNVLGHGVLENRDEGVYVYGTFNDTEYGNAAKEAVKHGDVSSLSIYANKLQQSGGDVIHGVIREVSLVLAGANPGAFIDSVLAHNSDAEEGIIAGYNENITLYHSDSNDEEEPIKKKEETKQMKDNNQNPDDKTVEEIINTMNDEQQNVLFGLIGDIVSKKENNSEGDDEMKHNIFDNEQEYGNGAVLRHSDEIEILNMAKSSQYGTFQAALAEYANNSALSHGISDEDITTLFPEYKDVYPGEPETITRDLTWVDKVMKGVHKSPVSRVRTRQFDARQTGIRANGYKKGKKKTEIGNVKLLNRTTDPQTVYVKDKLNRDDIVDFTDFSLVDYTYKTMKQGLNEEIAIAIMVGDGREDGDEYKISEDHIRPIWHDDDLYTIHHDVDIAATRKELQGTDTSKHFSDNYVYAEAIIQAALYSRESYKGSGSLSFYCTPHLLNVMLLARDMNGRRIYESKSDLAAALNVVSIDTAEQFEGLQRTTKDGKKKKLLGIFVNLDDYQVGSTKGGEITTFNDFDIDFNQEKYLMETRLSGALTRVYSAIALEEPVDTTSSGSVSSSTGNDVQG